ncbi:hypothetical protein Desaci_4095 [Desulfosporosinus acidiphilus SJ4]|uniref:Transmembrane protein n=1 Tax=Desulfosporosinus acidiphilus (strain DSM 22704 / JCM 16185 / SJ4) TaxID=646529 RepID=I4DAY4_DESAJ|nr:hypothetical protein Desaci_4095 [Desulfosporosinus acidiphilus SJ4]
MWAFLVVYWWLPLLISIVLVGLAITFGGHQMICGDGSIHVAFIFGLGAAVTYMFFCQRFNILTSVIPKM